ncbi:MAG: hypothetical protein IPM98_16570 [Lewinellaceae bacterium]|nr:hypothetical protein [Lewinellaceae bacterium]
MLQKLCAGVSVELLLEYDTQNIRDQRRLDFLSSDGTRIKRMQATRIFTDLCKESVKIRVACIRLIRVPSLEICHYLIFNYSSNSGASFMPTATRRSCTTGLRIFLEQPMRLQQDLPTGQTGRF